MKLNLSPKTYPPARLVVATAKPAGRAGHLKHNKGFALLISVILSTIILTIGISIISTAIKETILASTIRNSLVSLYMADSGTECALYWDNIRGNFQKNSVFRPGPGPQVSRIECANKQVDVYAGNDSGFWLRDDSHLNNACVQVTVGTRPASDKEEHIKIRSWGFNTCDPASTRRVDRALETNYSRFQ